MRKSWFGLIANETESFHTFNHLICIFNTLPQKPKRVQGSVLSTQPSCQRRTMFKETLPCFVW
ncbi:MAG TPA: hypothetical protein DCE42_06415 [Myxococcales bacterium]|nr:hypothetical protein [Myxococcales bacterium]